MHLALPVIAALLFATAATPPSPAPKKDAMAIEWEVLTAMIQGGTNNGYALNCDDPTLKAKSLTFVMESKTGKTTTAKTECTKGGNRGIVNIQLPAGGAPYNIKAVVDGKPQSASEHVKGFAESDSVHVRIYALGCTDEKCT